MTTTFKDFLAKLVGKGAKQEHDPFTVLDRVPGVRNLDAEDELERRAEANARGAALRAERAAFWGQVLDGRSRWMARSPGWLKPRGRDRW